jgi:hypothetical protein
VLAGLLGIPPIPETPRGDFQVLASSFMNEADGPYRLARALLDEANSLGMENVAIDGIRQRSTLQELKTLSTDVSSGRNGRPLAVLFVHAAPDVRLIMDEDEDEDIEPSPPDEENEAFDAGWQAANRSLGCPGARRAQSLS